MVYLFQSTVQRTVALAIWMPIIAGMGGNAGTQALAVTVRRLALGLIPSHLFARVVGKEVLVGMVNGLAIGGVVGLVAALIGDEPRLGLVVFLAMTGNLLVAGFAGGLHPVLLERFRIDPGDRVLDLRDHLHGRLRVPPAAGPGGMAAALTAR